MTRIQLSALKGHLSFRKLSCLPPSSLLSSSNTLSYTHTLAPSHPSQSLTLTFFSTQRKRRILVTAVTQYQSQFGLTTKKSVTLSRSMKFDLCHYAYITNGAQLCIHYSFSHPLFAFVMLKSVTDIFFNHQILFSFGKPFCVFCGHCFNIYCYAG